MANPFRTPGTAASYTQPFSPALKTALSNMNSPFRLDEGYSEDTRSQSEADVMRVDSGLADVDDRSPQTTLDLPDWVKSLTEAERSEFAYALLRSLRTSSIAAIVERLTPLLHIDFVDYLPAEITLEILTFLDIKTLLKCTQVSKSWRSRALDNRLWRQLFTIEGWQSNMRELRSFRDAEGQRFRASKEKEARARRVRSVDDVQHAQKKRMREGGLFGDGSALMAKGSSAGAEMEGPEGWVDQHGVVEADEGSLSDDYDHMQDVAYQSIPTPSTASSSPDGALVRSRDGPMDLHAQALPTIMTPGRTPASSMYLRSPDQETRLNWQFLYKQKRRLEENWTEGRFKNFQLPHPNHREEAHAECVYTIQYSGKYLVSGSRDKTLRIWNLETQRLVRPALKGHDASVLCLQFDERPEEDIIVSGGSDCHVILWRFSTGELIHKMTKAHSESVLNLRFDSRYLITCSKDKTIKVWNRHDLLPTDDAYPSHTTSGAKFPSYIINMQQAVELDYLHTKPLPPHTLLMTLHGHTAAVNAIQILNDQIVSASGDRSIKLWDVKTGTCIQTYTGHSKGIACVQYDGRRIVSGSSDETVRIFDRASGAEVACLRGHTVLVRTVQARFGDQPGNEAELEAEARAVDNEFFEARDKGLIPRTMTREQRRARNAGSRDPRNLFAIGAKIPPGGGGTRWGRIVSGSYDETVIIWKRDPIRGWVIAHKLLQTEAVQNAGGGRSRALPVTRGPGNQPVVLPVLHNGIQPPANAAAGAAPINGAPQAQQIAHPAGQAGIPPQNAAAVAATPAAAAQPPATAAANGTAAPINPTQQQQQGQQQWNSQQQQPPAPQQQQPPGFQPGPAAQGQAPGNPFLHPQLAAQMQQQLQAQGIQNTGAAPLQAQAQAQPPQQQPQQPPQPQPQQAPQQQQQQQQPHHHHHHHHHHHAGGQPHPPQLPQPIGMNSRVFKLQFDARRIICCSQDPTIVGWDFANGDRDIEDASRFFGEEG